jgi:hypothetical protein
MSASFAARMNAFRAVSGVSVPSNTDRQVSQALRSALPSAIGQAPIRPCAASEGAADRLILAELQRFERYRLSPFSSLHCILLHKESPAEAGQSMRIQRRARLPAGCKDSTTGLSGVKDRKRKAAQRRAASRTVVLHLQRTERPRVCNWVNLRLFPAAALVWQTDVTAVGISPLIYDGSRSAECAIPLRGYRPASQQTYLI